MVRDAHRHWSNRQNPLHETNIFGNASPLSTLLYQTIKSLRQVKGDKIALNISFAALNLALIREKVGSSLTGSCLHLLVYIYERKSLPTPRVGKGLFMQSMRSPLSTRVHSIALLASSLSLSEKNSLESSLLDLGNDYKPQPWQFPLLAALAISPLILLRAISLYNSSISRQHLFWVNTSFIR